MKYNQNFKVLFNCDIDDDFIQFEIKSKGCLFGTTFKINKGNEYKVNFYDSTRFKQDIDDELKIYKFFYPKNIIFIDEVTKEKILIAISEIVETKVYEKMVLHK